MESLYVRNDFSYDHMGRAVDTYQKTANSSGPTVNNSVLLSRRAYIEIGQLKSKNLHSTNSGSTFAQPVSYAYNERGWLSSQSSTLFTQSLKYNEAVSGVTAQYNGNIERQEWTGSKYYNYGYDAVNRLTSAIASTGNNEELSYDKMGNILTLQRKLTNAFVDQLSYTYAAGSNQLGSIADANSNSSAEYQLPGTTSYSYNGNGSMTARTNSGSTGNNISAISYNHMGLPKTMTTGGNTLTYTSDGNGTKLRKVFGAVSNSDYISGIHYEGGTFQFMQTAEGRVTRNGTATDAVYLYEYTLEDHLGNGRVYFDINGGTARKIQEEEYYAFGKAVQVGSFLGSENRYQYNGKEKQDELKMLDYGARFYDPIIGRFNTVDPLADEFDNVSPLSYAMNNPALMIDPTGMSADTSKVELPKVEAKSVQLKEVEITGWRWPTWTFNIPIIGAAAKSGNNLSDGNYGTSAANFGQALLEMFTLGFAYETKAGATLATETGVTVYTSVTAGGKTQYVGITNNLARRAAEHLAKKGIIIQPLLRGLSRSDARAVEQALIEIHGLGKGGGTLLNKINSIATSNPSYGAQIQRGYELLKSIGYK